MAAPAPSSDPTRERQSSTSSSSSSKASSDAVLRNALRYTLSAREYAAMHKYILSRSRALRRATPTPSRVEKVLQPPSGSDDFNTKTVRHVLRIFVGSFLGMKGMDAFQKRMGDKDANANAKKPFYKSPALRLSLSVSTILLLYRLLFRFLTRLRIHLLDPQVEPFRLRNPRTAATLTSPYAPAVGASFAGLALGIFPSDKMRVSMAIFAIFRALEFSYNLFEKEGLLWGIKSDGSKKDRPWWFGSWMIQPVALGQLLHAAVFDRECFPKDVGDFIANSTSTYLHVRPEDWPLNLKWPKTSQIVDSLAEMARLNWPAYISPTLFPNKEDVLPASLSAIAPLTSRAHPLITSLSCATLHPADPSCARTYLTFWLNSFPPMARFFVLIYSALTVVPNVSGLYHNPLATLRSIISGALRTSTAVTGAISTAWASICFFQTWLPRHVLATQRFFLSGFFAGLWAWMERRNGRGFFLYSARASVDSLWKVGVKRRWWKSMKGGDVWIFMLAMMITGMVHERDAKVIEEGNWRKGMSWVQGQGWRDWGAEEDEDEKDEDREKEE